MDAAMRIATGEEMSNSPFGTGFVVNMQRIKFGRAYSTPRKQNKISNAFH